MAFEQMPPHHDAEDNTPLTNEELKGMLKEAEMQDKIDRLTQLEREEEERRTKHGRANA